MSEFNIMNAIFSSFFQILKIVLFVAFVIFLFTAIRMYIRHKKYGYDYFSVFRKREKINAKKMQTLLMIRQINPTMLSYDTESDYFIASSTSFGILLVFVFPFHNITLKGNYKDEILSYNEGRKHVYNVKNPFYIIQKEEERIKKINPTIPIKSYVIFDTRILLMLEGKTDIEIVRTENFYYKLESYMKENLKYSKEEIKQNWNTIKPICDTIEKDGGITNEKRS